MKNCLNCGDALVGFGAADNFCSTTCKAIYGKQPTVIDVISTESTEVKKEIYTPISFEAALRIVHLCCGFDKMPYAVFKDNWARHPFAVRRIHEVRLIGAHNLDFRAMYNIFKENAPKDSEANPNQST